MLYNKQTDRQTKNGCKNLVFAFGRHFSFLFWSLGTAGKRHTGKRTATTKQHVCTCFLQAVKLHCNTFAACNGHKLNMYYLN